MQDEPETGMGFSYKMSLKDRKGTPGIDLRQGPWCASGRIGQASAENSPERTGRLARRLLCDSK
jgi:hypothetical protein